MDEGEWIMEGFMLAADVNIRMFVQVWSSASAEKDGEHVRT